ncbi:MAG TPA: adenosine deaminase [Anaerolineales bacterium]|nr:adenosine deaminase [Anaerolineales bacterium]HNQ94965.1 adenosine deaminase [Anaerolineales bacterium]HNS61702.1 adenosine deaminase [Anaerolineales bacterium]
MSAVERVTASLNTYRALPKVELHRHLEGSLRLDTMLDIATQHGITIPADVLRLSTLVQIQEEDKLTFQNFLSKFNTLRLFYRSPDVIHRITREAIEDAAKDNVKYMELRFTPVALSRAERFPLHDVIDWVISSAKEASEKHGVIVRLIASVNRHESAELAEQVAWLAADHVKDGLVALDLAGNEADFPSQPFYGIFKEAKQAGLHVTIHAGEWGPAYNVSEAIEEIGAERIGHGVRVMEDESIVKLARERQTAFEVCITSNYQSGIFESLETHPLTQMLDAGLNVTINTDDPSISRITLSHEYYTACEDLKMPQTILKQRIVAAAKASFIEETEKEKLVKQLEKDLKL